MLSNPMMASTAPLAATRSPRRVMGLDSGSIRLASLTNSSSCSRCCGDLRDSGSLRTACSRAARFSSTSACIGRVSMNSTPPSSGPRERRRNPVLPARSTKNVVADRGATVNRSGRHQSSSCEATHSICRGGEVPGVRELEHQHDEVLVLDGRRPALRVELERLTLDLDREGAREQRVQLRPFRRDPALVPEQPKLGVEAEVADLPRNQFRQQHLPLAVLRPVLDFARERGVARLKALRQSVQGLPELAFDLRTSGRRARRTVQ